MDQSPPSDHPTRLAPGDRLDRYEVVALLGVGGMGEVYRAHDPQLARDVALKVLLRRDARAEDLERFSREARAAGSLNHPNIVAVYDVGTHGEVPYVVTELLEGETLRARLDHGPLPLRKAIDYGVQIAQALAAAHAKRIWHRDVKPANVFVTQDGRVKLLDFGIAKLMSQRTLRAKPDDITGTLTEASAVMGTAGYMAPEQVLSQAVDHRADIFGLGAVLYEMFTGARPFKRSTKFETMRAVLDADPADPVSLNPDLSPMAADIVRRCLEKNPEERFQSARDLAFALQQVGEGTGTTGRLVLRRRRGDSGRLRWGLGAALVLAVNAALWLLTAGPPARPTYTPLAFGRMHISSARFVSEGQVVFSQAREGSETDLWQVDDVGRPEQKNRPLGVPYPSNSDILAVGPDDWALLLKRRLVNERVVGTLARQSGSGDAPRPEYENVEGADFLPGGGNLVLVKSEGTVAGRSWLEYPPGTPLYEPEAGASLRFPRVSPNGRYVAFVEGRSSGAGGEVKMLDLDLQTETQNPTVLTREYPSVSGLAWFADGEVWFSAGDDRSHRGLHAVDIEGQEREVWTFPGSVTLWDISDDGALLMSSDEDRRFTVVKPPGATEERSLAWEDDTGVADISADGSRIVFADRSGLYIRDTDGSPPMKLGLTYAYADAVSPDGKLVLATTRDTNELMVLPTGPGSEPRPVTKARIVSYRGARWFPDLSGRILFNGREQDHEIRAYVQDVEGGAPEPVTDEGYLGLAASTTGRLIAAIKPGEGISIWPTDGSPRFEVLQSRDGDRPVAWSPDDQFLWVFRREAVPASVLRVSVASGTREHRIDLRPSDMTGVYAIVEFATTPDGAAYAYSYKRRLSELYLVRLPQ